MQKSKQSRQAIRSLSRKKQSTPQSWWCQTPPEHATSPLCPPGMSDLAPITEHNREAPPARWRRVCSNAMERSRLATISSTFLILETRMAEEICLTQYGLMAERHWREFRPAMVREMEAKGTLTAALFEAQEKRSTKWKRSLANWKGNRSSRHNRRTTELGR